ncbi:4-aminobutyrate aminotransferase-like enzyme/Ser/Thr protein kinase RdoA (MazF antagonist) [Peteryoungia aggregata LMG 23059]|uniref:4-aminobutyrate aminotransferase-like enzyme/Ser/Thr protein kinase RdoA (MazF antagonist) n=1 Tax=Peteryoungia aggregata LMG 23059 TaxID=1368425 RepID=A0ABU0GDN6_9HYPH|nr:aminotransferase [Peteryoungia aggregata]MDQ0423418.1 4-aminobutyrate aminotransferase-like enzyme/Ser/Thr protein kinase RdoA (MazF antagonist) [Peteryoungia aggregata LMG 23059]
MADSALLQRTELPRPNVSLADAKIIFNDFYGFSGPIRELGSQQDRNFLIDTGEERLVLKVTRAEYPQYELDAQNRAMDHLRGLEIGLRIPEPIPALTGEYIPQIELGGEHYWIRLLSYLDGEPLTLQKHLPPEVVAAFGDVVARVAMGLRDFRHEGLQRELQWDLRRAGPVALHLLKSVTDQKQRDRIAKAMIVAVKRLQPLASELRIQPIHHDITDDNVVATPNASRRLMPDGVIDFGDVLYGWLVADLAVTCAALLHHADGDPFFILPAVKAFHQRYPLNEAELRALWPLIVARAGVLVASSEQQLSIDPDNEYILGNIDHERMIFEVATSVPHSLMQAAILHAAGLLPDETETPVAHSLLPSLTPDDFRLTDLTVTSPDLPRDSWADQEIDWKLLARAALETGVASTRYGEYRLSYTKLLSATPPATFALHIDVCLPGATEAFAPFDATVILDGHHLILSSRDLSLHLDGIDCSLENGASVTAGDPIGAVAGAAGGVGGLRIQLCRDPDLIPPLFSKPQQSAIWRLICPSPSRLLGVGVDAPAPESHDLLERRKKSFARPQKNYYADPPQIERGWKEHLFDVKGRAYLDMVNNVTILGHGHPRLAEAVGRQWALLNTNSRFHYAAVAEFSDRLASLAPEGLDTVFLVNSGSEAVDLALRLAWAHSGHRNVLSLLEAYHGWTVASDAVSTSIADNPRALETRPDWVHPVLSPNTYRGRYRCEGSTGGYVAAVAEKIAEIEDRGGRLGGFIAESLYGNAGGIPLPPGYLREVYALVREHGGLCIADEVQVGYGRLGHHFWGFEQQGEVPDIITVAKGMGNGQPLGAVITRREIADSLEKEGYFFSSSGGSPVSCVVGMTVLDIIKDENLQENARDVGDHLKLRLEALGQRFPIVGAVHGMGLYLGLEFVRDRETLEPATEETAAICDRLLECGVIMQPTGDHLNVLKIKPPLCLTRESADFFAEMLEKVLSEGW